MTVWGSETPGRQKPATEFFAKFSVIVGWGLAFVALQVLLLAVTPQAAAQDYWQGKIFKSKAGRTANTNSSGGGLLGKLFGGGNVPVSSRDREFPDNQPLYSYDSYPFRGAQWGQSSGGRYRTMCVRLCDGYYFPVSFKTNGANLDADDVICQSSCDAPARLFYYRNPGEEIENMRDLDGQAYSSLKNAFRYRKEFVSDCRCRPEPWTREARRKHEAYAARETGKEVKRDRQASLPRFRPQFEAHSTVSRLSLSFNNGKTNFR
jgi:hypothetical protein